MLERGSLEAREDESEDSYSVGNVEPGRLADERAMNWGMNQAVDMPSTSHFSILDSNGNVVSMTTSVEGPFGSHLRRAA